MSLEKDGNKVYLDLNTNHVVKLIGGKMRICRLADAQQYLSNALQNGWKLIQK